MLFGDEKTMRKFIFNSGTVCVYRLFLVNLQRKLVTAISVEESNNIIDNAYREISDFLEDIDDVELNVCR